MSIAHQSIEQLSTVLDLYKLDIGNYTSTEQGLRALVTKPADAVAWTGPYLKGTKDPVDAWNRPVPVYRNPSSRPDHDYDLCSEGPSGKAAGSSAEDLICHP